MRKPVFVMALAVLLAGFAARAQPGGEVRLDHWGSGYQMGTAWAGITTSNGGIRLSVFCGDREAAAANPAIRSGPSLLVAISKISPPRDARALRFVVDGKATALPVTIEQVPDAVNFHWKPSRAFDARNMSVLLADLRKAKRFHLVAVAGAEREVPLEGVREALSDDIVACR